MSVANAVQAVPMKLLIEVSKYVVSGDKSAKKGTQLCVTKKSYINKEPEK